MARFKKYQTAFNNGQVDANVSGRFDTTQYQSAAAEIKNAVCMPQGGVRKRLGFRHIDTVNSTNGTSRLELFEFSTTQSYVILFTAGSIKVYDAINQDLEAVITTNYTHDEIYEIDFTQSYDVMILTHPNHQPVNLVRRGNANWGIEYLPFTNIPTYTYPTVADTSDPTDPGDPDAPSTALPNTYDKQTIHFSGVSVGNTFKLSVNNNLGSSIGYNEEDTEDDIRNSLSSLIGNNNLIVKPIIDVQVNPIGDIGGEPDGFETIRTLNHFEIEFTGVNIGQMSIISSSNSGLTITAIGSGSGGSGGSGGGNTDNPDGTDDTDNSEPVWSDDRGWPATVTFFQDRLWFGGSKSRPTTLWGSRTGRYFDFSVESDADVVPDDYIEFALNTDQINKITSIHADRNLIILTGAAEFYVSSEKLTPEDFVVRSTSRNGSIRAKPVNYDNTTMYITNQGSSIRDFSYDFSSDGYISNSITKLASSVIKDPRQIVSQKNNKADESDYLYIRNSDGTMSVFSGDRVNGVAAWSTIQSQLGFESIVITESGKVWITATRDLGGSTITTIETQEEGLYLDSAIDVTCDSNGVAYGLDILCNHHITIVNDKGNKVMDYQMDGSTSIDLGDEYADRVVTLGMTYEFKIETLPVSAEGTQGNIRDSRKRVVRAFVELLNAIGVKIAYNGKTRPIKGRTLPAKLGESPKGITGVNEVRLNGYSKTTQISLIQNEPYAATVLGLGLELEV